MRCIYCEHKTEVKDSRLHSDNTIRRRRRCLRPKCGKSFSTSEKLWVKKSWDISHTVDPIDPKTPLREKYSKKQDKMILSKTSVIDLPVQAPIRKAKEKKEIDWQWAAENLSDEELEELIHDH